MSIVEESTNWVTDEQMFDKIKEHLLTQMHKSMTVNGTCAYRGIAPKDFYEHWTEEAARELGRDISFRDIEDGAIYKDSYHYDEIVKFFDTIPKNAACALGCILSDEFYKKEFNTLGITKEEVKQAVRDSNPNWDMSGYSWAMLKRLQEIHDTDMPETWEVLLSGFSFMEDGTYWDYNYPNI